MLWPTARPVPLFPPALVVSQVIPSSSVDPNAVLSATTPTVWSAPQLQLAPVLPAKLVIPWLVGPVLPLFVASNIVRPAAQSQPALLVRPSSLLPTTSALLNALQL